MKNQSKKSLHNKCRISSSSKRKVLESFKSNKIKNPDTISTPGQTLDFPVFDTPKPTNAQTSKSKNKKLCENFVNENVNDEKDNWSALQ